mgnify:CR=1 FL=1
MTNRVQILLIEDEKNICSFIEHILEPQGYRVISANTGKEGLQYITSEHPDVILLDLGLPDMDGLKLIEQVRSWSITPIIVISARTLEKSKIAALDLGADDYLPKPFNDRELVARIRAILRRSHWSEQQQNNDNGSPTLEVDALVLNPGRQEASFDGQTLELTGTEFTLLYLLAQHLGQVVSREHLSQEVLGKRLTPFDRAIDMHISNLRRKLPDRKDGHPWFKTLRGRGYLMVSAS